MFLAQCPSLGPAQCEGAPAVYWKHRLQQAGKALSTSVNVLDRDCLHFMGNIDATFAQVGEKPRWHVTQVILPVRNG